MLLESPLIHYAHGTALMIAYEEHGDAAGWPVVLLHGFPYDPRCYDDVVPPLLARGAHIVVPYLRGFGPTSFNAPETLRSGQQAALAHDLRDLIRAIPLERPIVTGFDWGGRAACVTALLWPELVAGLVTIGGYNVLDVQSMSVTPSTPEIERRKWYQWYLHGDVGRAGLERFRREFARALWTEWSPGWDFAPATFEASAMSLENPDFVDVVLHSYRHRYGLVEGDPDYDGSEALIALLTPIVAPTIVVDRTREVLGTMPSHAEHSLHFENLVDRRIVDTGHNTPQEAPGATADAVLALHRHLLMTDTGTQGVRQSETAHRRLDSATPCCIICDKEA